MINKILKPFVNRCFLLNVTLNTENKIIDFVTGDPVIAFKRGVEALKRTVMVKTDKLYDVAVVSGGGAPLDNSFYQSIKGYLAALNIIKKGGKIILLSGCDQGVGSESFEKFMKRTPEQTEKLISRKPAFYHDQWMAQHLLQIKRVALLYLYSPGIKKGAINGQWVTQLEKNEVFELINREKTACNNIAVLPFAPYIVPFYHKRLRYLNTRFANPE
jgi:nickel-dependent lactate racemase